MKVIRNIFLAIWTLIFIIGIANNCSNYGIGDWIVIIIVALAPYFIFWSISHKAKQATNNVITNNPKDNVVNNTYIETKSTIKRVDNNAISDEEIPYLMQIGFEKALSAEKTSKNPKFHRTEKEEELSFQFFTKYAHIADSLSDDFTSLYREAYKINDLSERIYLLEEAIAAFEKAKKYCYSKGKGGTIYFQDTWEHMHNSQNEDYSYLDIINNGLTEAIFERDTIIPSVIDTISTNDGILQKDLYKELPSIKKSDIQRIIRKLENENILQRIKKSNSYELHLTK